MSKQTIAKNQSDTSALDKRRSRTGRSKREQLIRMLSAPRGVGAETIDRKFGWQAHTTRAALSGLRKAGFEVRTEKSIDGKPTRYRIVAAPKQDASTDAA